MITPQGLRRSYSLAIAVLVHAILIVLLIGAAMIPRGSGGQVGSGVGLEWQDGDSDVDARDVPAEAAADTADVNATAPAPEPETVATPATLPPIETPPIAATDAAPTDTETRAPPVVIAPPRAPTPTRPQLKSEVAATTTTPPPPREPAARLASRMALSPGGRAGGDLYLAKVRAHLARFRQPLPLGVRSQGTVALRFRLSASGAVSALQIETSSGDAALDQQAIDLLMRATPLPARQHATELIVPIEFGTRTSR